MINIYGIKSLTRLDICFGFTLIFIFLLLTLNIHLKSMHLVYIVILTALLILLHPTLVVEKKGSSIRDLWIMSGFSTLLYPFVDQVFVLRLSWVEYLTNDPRVLATPPYVVLYWAYGVLLFGYVCLRINGMTDNLVISGLMTGIFAAASAVLIENLFNAMGFYRNMNSNHMIRDIPIFVAFGYIATFFFTPFYIRYKYISGFFLYVIIGFFWYLSFHIVSWIVTL